MASTEKTPISIDNHAIKSYLSLPMQSTPSLAPSNFVMVLVLLYICVISINNYFCYHEPSAIAQEFEDYYSLTTQQFGTLFTIYSLPNVILVFFSGQLIDYYGLRRASFLFNILILSGMIVAALTPILKSHDNKPSSVVYFSLLMSRLLLGLGGESIVACATTMVSKWYSHTNHLNTAMAINQAFVQIFGSAAAFYILPHVHSIIQSQYICIYVCLLSLLANYFYNSSELYYEKYLLEQQSITEQKRDSESFSSATTIEMVIETGTASNMDQERPSYSGIQDYDTPANSSSWLPLTMAWETLQKFPILFYILLLHISLVSPILYTFTAFGPLYLQQTFAATASATAAGDAISLLYMSIVIAPLTGVVVDYIGYRSYVQFFATLNLPIIFLLLTYEYINPHPAMLWMGSIYSVTESNGLALISLIVPSELIGTAFGLLGCCISLALLVEPASVGYIHEVTGSFKISIWIFFGLTFAGSILALYMIIYDTRHLNLISKRTIS